jgi:hypothetical protein
MFLASSETISISTTETGPLALDARLPGGKVDARWGTVLSRGSMWEIPQVQVSFNVSPTLHTWPLEYHEIPSVLKG